MLKVGMIIDNRYKILREIGRGGTSCVYLAENIRLHNYWAIKEVYRSGVTGQGVLSNSLIAESNILTKLCHPGLPSIIDVLDTPQSYLIVMEYIEGVSLDKVLEERGAQSETNVVKWGRQLCEVLKYLHDQKPSIIYRDMKPANIMLKPDGDVVLIDFGMAREFKTNSRRDTTNLGTHGYAAPEQYNGSQQTDERTDVYSLGVTLFHLVTGHDPCSPPYGVGSIRSFNPSLSWKLDQIISKCTQYQPENRYQNVESVENALGQVYVMVPNDIEVSPEDEPKQNNSFLWLLAIIPVVFIVVILGVVLSLGTLNDLDQPGRGNDVGFFDQVLGFFREDSDVYSGNAGDFSEDDFFLQEVYISYPDERQYYTFVPEISGSYHFFTENEGGIPIVWVTDSQDKLIVKDNTAGEYADVDMYCWLEEGETYYIETTLYDLDPSADATGYYWIYIEYLSEKYY